MTQRFTCRRAGNKNCNFAVESDRENELVNMAQQHAKNVHDMELSRKDVRNSLKTIKPASS